MQWWGALTKQFTELATTAMKDTATDAAKNLAGAMVKQSFDAAGQTLKKAASVPAKVAREARAAAQARPTAHSGRRAARPYPRHAAAIAQYRASGTSGIPGVGP